MRILFLGCYRDCTGYGYMALNTMMALISAGADVTARPIKLNNTVMTLPPEIIQAENKPAGRFDVVIQNTLPHHFEYNGKIPLNVGYYCTETSRFDGTVWPEKINTMDRAWVCSQDSLDASRRSGVDVPAVVIPIAADMSRYQRKHKHLSIRDKLSDSFIFYYIGEFNLRKNIRALIQAFHLEFSPDEPVELVLKTKFGSQATSRYEEDKNREKMLKDIDMVKQGMKLYRSPDHYKKEVVISGNYSDEDILRLHSSCDCFVCPSHGEAWCLPAFDAMALGKTPIVSDDGGFREYLDHDSGYMVHGSHNPVWGMTRDTFPGMYTSRETWYDISIADLQANMREAYNNRGNRTKSNCGRLRAYDFSYNRVGKIMVESLLCK